MNHFDPETHSYTINGVKVPSVTGLICRAGLVDSTWYTPQSRDRGTYVHEACALYDRGTLDDSTVDPRIRPYLDAWVKFQGIMKPGKFSVIEQPFYSEKYGYAGTIDRAWPHMGSDFVCDIKTGDFPAWLPLQLAGYSLLLPRCFSGMGVQLMPTGRFKIKRFKTFEMMTARTQFLEILKNGKI